MAHKYHHLSSSRVITHHPDSGHHSNTPPHLQMSLPLAVIPSTFLLRTHGFASRTKDLWIIGLAVLNRDHSISRQAVGGLLTQALLNVFGRTLDKVIPSYNYTLDIVHTPLHDPNIRDKNHFIATISVSSVEDVKAPFQLTSWRVAQTLSILGLLLVWSEDLEDLVEWDSDVYLIERWPDPNVDRVIAKGSIINQPRPLES